MPILWENKNTVKLSSAEHAQRVVKVKQINSHLFLFQVVLVCARRSQNCHMRRTTWQSRYHVWSGGAAGGGAGGGGAKKSNLSQAT